MQGYGDPTSGGAGYGDPTSTKRNRGYGSPYDDVASYISLDTRTVHHKGGAEVIVQGALLPAAAPYRLSVLIDGVRTFLYSGKAGQGPNLFLIRGEIKAYTYPMTAGAYNVTLHYGASFAQSAVFPQQLIVVADSRGAERYKSRQLWPAHYKTGARFNEIESIDLAAAFSRTGTLEILADSWGRIIQALKGSPSTVVRENAAFRATTILLESGYSFPSSGKAWIHGRLYNYVLSGASMTIESGLDEAVPTGAEVIYYDV